MGPLSTAVMRHADKSNMEFDDELQGSQKVLDAYMREYGLGIVKVALSGPLLALQTDRAEDQPLPARLTSSSPPQPSELAGSPVSIQVTASKACPKPQSSQPLNLQRVASQCLIFFFCNRSFDYQRRAAQSPGFGEFLDGINHATLVFFFKVFFSPIPLPAKSHRTHGLH